MTTDLMDANSTKTTVTAQDTNFPPDKIMINSDKNADISVQTDHVLWQQLSEINLALKLPRHNRATVKILEGLRDSTRTLIHNRVRPKLRPLKILDLPDELLIRIFDYLKADTHIYELYIFHWGFNPAGDIKNLRLTCRRFYETSSHLLLHYVNVGMTRSSLAHLDEVSRHPSVSKGIRFIHLSLGPFYDSVLAHDIQAFAAYRASKLRQSIVAWERAVNWHDCGKIPIEVYQGAITKATPLAESWEELATQGIDMKCADHLIISRAHEQYLQLYENQKNISSSLAQAIASAMTRMPTATWVKIDDQNIYDDSGWAIGSFRLKDFDETDSLLKKLLSPVEWSDARKHGLGPPPFNVAEQLLFLIQRLEIPLAGLDIETPPPIASSSNTATTHEPTVLHAAFKQLKAFSFRPQGTIHDVYWTERAPEKWVHFTSLLRSLLHTKSLQKISLDFYFMIRDEPPLLLSMAPLLSYTWPKLKILYFNGPFHFEELKAAVKPLGPNTEVQWAGYLMSGSWADVLDFLRERNTVEQELGDVNDSIYGQEYDRMTMIERRYIFKQDRSHMLPSIATRYIRGWIPRNPVRDWENGDLDIPELSEDEEE
ncbi:hypothetical protein F5B20DRAFT_559734 [Whalleya microplaca]|nr:hypothetical protein F5B20DRAFT_559734 [Whalleya microplaca]